MCLYAVQQVSAQQVEPAATASTNQAVDLISTGLQIGDKVPDILIENIHNYKSSSARLSDFKGKLLILDFWATWCSPCVAMFPKMDSLQREFGDRVQFLSVTYQREQEVLPFLKRLERRRDKPHVLPTVVEDSTLQTLFPHKYLPHYVWIDQQGNVRAITSHDEINGSNIRRLITDGEDIALKEKRDIIKAYDVTKPYFFQEPANSNSLIRYAALHGYQEGVASGWYNNSAINNDPFVRITAMNVSIFHLYNIAYGEGKFIDRKHTLIKSETPGKIIEWDKHGDEYLNWLRDGNGYCYEIIVDPQLEACIV